MESGLMGIVSVLQNEKVLEMVMAAAQQPECTNATEQYV